MTVKRISFGELFARHSIEVASGQILELLASQPPNVDFSGLLGYRVDEVEQIVIRPVSRVSRLPVVHLEAFCTRHQLHHHQVVVAPSTLHSLVMRRLKTLTKYATEQHCHDTVNKL